MLALLRAAKQVEALQHVFVLRTMRTQYVFRFERGERLTRNAFWAPGRTLLPRMAPSSTCERIAAFAWERVHHVGSRLRVLLGSGERD